MSADKSEKPLECSTPIRRFALASDNESTVLNDLSYDYDALELLSDAPDYGSQYTVTSQVWSVETPNSAFNRQLASEFDETLFSFANNSDSFEQSDVFTEAHSELPDQTIDNKSAHLSVTTPSERVFSDIVFEEPADFEVGSPVARPDGHSESDTSSARSIVRNRGRSTMAPSNKDKYLKVYRHSVLIWEDTYEHLDKDTILPDTLESTIIKLEQFINTLQDVQLHFDESPAAEFTVDNLNLVKELRRKASALKASVQKVLYDYTQHQAAQDRDTAAATAQAAAAATATAQARARAADAAAIGVARITITAMEPTLTSTCAELVDGHKALRDTVVTNPGEYKRLEAAAKLVEDDCEVTVSQLEGLKKEAVTAGDLAAAERMIKLIKQLNDERKLTVNHVRDGANTIGYLPGQSETATANLNLKPPVFSGVISDSLDYFTFTKKLTDYFESVGVYSHHAMLIKLKSECLSEPAASAVKNHETYSGAMCELKRLYGQARVLFAAKVKEIKKLGKCPDTSAETRTWGIEMKNYLTNLSKMATEHKISGMFESSMVVDVIESAMKARDQYKFRDKLRDQSFLDPDFDLENKSERVKLLTQYLSELIDKATFDLNYNMSKSYKATEAVIGGEKSKEKVSDKAKEKPVSKKAYLGTAASGCGGCCDNCPQGSSGSKAAASNGSKTFNNSTPNIVTNKSDTPKDVMCKVCKVEHSHLSYCEAYQRAEVTDKFKMVCAVKACPRCLRMDAAFSYDYRKAWMAAHLPYCTSEYLCDVGDCANRPAHFQNNITLCPRHFEENKERQDEYMQSLDQQLLKDGAKFYYNHHGMFSATVRDADGLLPPAEDGKIAVVEPDVSDPAVYMLQWIPGPKGEKLLMFYDSGCYMAAISDEAYGCFQTKTVRPGPTRLDAAANSHVNLEHGDEQFLLQLHSDDDTCRYATLTALRMPEVSSEFPLWPLSEAWKGLQVAYDAKMGGNGLPLPTVEDAVGGDKVQIMVGIQYQRYFPELVFSLPGGLSIYRAKFLGVGGHQGVLGGPSPRWKEIAQRAHYLGPAAYLISELRAHRVHVNSLKSVMSLDDDWMVQGDMMSSVEKICCSRRVMAVNSPNKAIRDMLELDEVGADIDYRCERCRICYDCKNAEKVEAVSLQEETEQFMIENSVSYDKDMKVMVAQLPFLETTTIQLSDNYFSAKKILESQIRQLNKRPGGVEQVELSHNKLRDRGYVMKLEDLPPDVRVAASQPGYYIPWRTVQSDSLSTPTRMVFDASSRTPSGNSLNGLLAKGRNMLADMLVLLYRFRFGSAAFCADVSMAYNGVMLHREHLRYQKYLWSDGLAVGGAIIVMVVLTLIYGVRPAGNLTMRAFQLTAEEAEKDERLKLTGGPACLRDSSYMDDVLAAFRNDSKRDSAADGLEETLAVSKMGVKAITKSGEDPCERVSADLKTVNVVGYVWEPAADTLRLDIKPLFLGKKIRGRRPPPVEGDVREALRSRFTRRELAGKIAAIYDPLGFCVPVTAKMKLSLREVVKITNDWDELVPEERLDEWVGILAEVQRLSEVVVERSILTADCGEGTKFELITCTDASQTLAVAATYLRVIKPGGETVCGLLTAKSKLITKLTIPRAELKACVMGVCLAEIVKRALKDDISSSIFVTDSAVALTWINTDQRPLQVGVRNAVIQIRRFSKVEDWFHVASDLNPADIGTRGKSVDEIKSGSPWQRGYPWMCEAAEKMPIKKLNDVEISSDEKVAVTQEVRNSGLQGIILNLNVDAVAARYELSRYIVDPADVPWPKFVRKVAVVLRVKRGFEARGDPDKLAAVQFPEFGGKLVVGLSDEDVAAAERYIFTKTSQELKKFNDLSKLTAVKERDGILVYVGRILDGAQPRNPLGVMLDLPQNSYVCPAIDRWSPIAYSIMVHAHVSLTHHGGAVSTLRAAETVGFVVSGRKLATEVVKDCAYCKRYRAKCEEAVMGGIPVERMTVAPAFYNCQIDLFGPFEAHCKHGRRSVVKVYGVAYKCMTTLAVAVNVMDSYDTGAFLDSFYRFSSRYGWPRKVYIDAGSQMMAAFKDNTFSMIDVSRTLNTDNNVKIEFAVCPVNAHAAHGLVERSILEIKKVLAAVFSGIKMDILRLETVFSWIGNELNSMPLCLGSKYRDLEHADLITPSRLLLGRNNKRAPAGLQICGQPRRVMDQIEEVERAWWTIWLREKLGDLVPRSKKWNDGSPDIEVGDVVVFVREKNDIVGVTWRLGLVEAVDRGEDGVCRRVTIKYRVVRENGAVENEFRQTTRSARHVAVLAREEDVDLAGQLSAAQKQASVMLCRSLLAG